MALQGLPGPEWFSTAHGADAPHGLSKEAVIRRTCRVTFYDSEYQGYIECKVRMILDSQNPRLVLSVGDQAHGTPCAQLVFTAENNTFSMAMEKEGDEHFETIQDARKEHPSWFERSKSESSKSESSKSESFDATTLYLVEVHRAPIETGQGWRLEGEAKDSWKILCQGARECSYMLVWKDWAPSHKNTEEILSWFGVLHSKTTAIDARETFWAYKAIEPSKLSDGSEGRRPELTWLRTVKEDGSAGDEYVKWAPSDPFFCNEEERKWHLVEGSRIERDTQYRAITSIFCTERRHFFSIEREPESSYCFVHVTVKIEMTENEQLPIPEITPPTRVEFTFIEKGNVSEIQRTDLSYSGTVVDRQSTSDFVLVVSNLPEIDPEGLFIIVVIKPNLQAIDRQITALQDAGTTRVYGDVESQIGQGYSLRKTIMTQGGELDPRGADYFELNICQLSSVDEHLQKERLEYILKEFPLDQQQRLAFNRSVYQVCAGVHLIQGPPGTGKTHTALVIVLAYACLNIRVMLAAGSNKGVDNLAAAVVRALEKDAHLRSWCGQLVRFRSPAYQISSLRARSASHTVVRRQPSKLSKDEDELLPFQMESLVLARARRDPTEETHNKFLSLLSSDEYIGLSNQKSKALKACLSKLSMSELEHTKIVATTLNNASQDLLRHPEVFQPQVLVCDESAQCLEGDHMIAMTITSIRVVILLGDPEQLPPTVLSENGTNESALFLKRSLMDRLYKAGYPCTTLTTNYRSHPQILDLYNREVYHGRLQAALANSAPEPVGNVWDEFTQSRHWFRAMGLTGVRRLFISVIGQASHPRNSQSWTCMAQVQVAKDLLKALYAFQSSNGEKIRPQDVMIISPYKDQKRLVDQVLSEENLDCRDNLTVDSSQGSEAKLVIYLMTKPSDPQGRNPGFLIDKQRMNVALSRAKKVQIIVGNLEIWSKSSIDHLARKPRNVFLVSLLRDVSAKGHTLSWSPEAVTEVEPPANFKGYWAHDSDRRRSVTARPTLTLQPRPSVPPPVPPPVLPPVLPLALSRPVIPETPTVRMPPSGHHEGRQRSPSLATRRSCSPSRMTEGSRAWSTASREARDFSPGNRPGSPRFGRENSRDRHYRRRSRSPASSIYSRVRDIESVRESTLQRHEAEVEFDEAEEAILVFRREKARRKLARLAELEELDKKLRDGQSAE